MRCFSELDLINRENYTNHNYHGFEEQLLWRYEDLKTKCDGIIDEDGNAIDSSEEEEDPNQISLFEVVLLPTWFQTAVAA